MMKKAILAALMAALTSAAIADTKTSAGGLSVSIGAGQMNGKTVVFAMNDGATPALVSLQVYKRDGLSDPWQPQTRIKRDGKEYALFWVDPPARVEANTETHSIIEAPAGEYLVAAQAMSVDKTKRGDSTVMNREKAFVVTGGK